MGESDVVQIEREEDIAVLQLNRPESLNAVNLTLLEEFHDALVDLSANPASGLVITGRGRATCAGMDTDIVSDPEYQDKYKDQIDELNDEIYDLLRTHPRPTVMAARGAVVGIGFIFSLYCDFVVLGRDTTFSLPEIRYGISTADIIPRLEKTVGLRAAKEIALTGDEIAPEHAHELGLATRVVPEEDVEETAHELAEQIGEYETWVVKDIKESTSDMH